MPTDREYLKMQQAGALATSGATDPIGEVGKAHEAVFTFLNVAGSPLAEIGYEIKKKARVKSVRAVPAANLATAAANYVTGTVAKRDGAGGSATTIASFTTNSSGGAALAAFVATDCALVAGTVDLPAGSILTYALVDNATTTEVAVAVHVTVEYV
jgi:hypothetical protein